MPTPGRQVPTHVLGRKGGTDWEEGGASSCCLGGAPFAPLRVVRVYDMLPQTFTSADRVLCPRAPQLIIQTTGARVLNDRGFLAFLHSQRACRKQM